MLLHLSSTIVKKKYKIYGYELGNEPAVWTFTWGTPIVTPQQHAADYTALRKLLNDDETVVGPDTTWGPVSDEKPDGTGRNPMGIQYDYWNETLQQNPEIDVAAFHYYAVQPGLVRSWRDFVNVAKNYSMCSAVAAHKYDFDTSPLAGLPLWLGEGGASYGGFNHDVKGDNWLRRFGGALSYLENLGCAASNGVDIFARQQLSNFITGNITHSRWRYTPQPSWWVAVLWKKIVGTAAWRTTITNVVKKKSESYSCIRIRCEW